MAADELAYVDAVGQADLVRSGTCTPADLVEGAAARIRRLNPLLNALVHESLERAMEEAQRTALPDGPLRGVPFAFKDVLGQTAGDPYHAGMRLLQQRRWTAQHDSYLAADLRRAGLVFVGRTNVPELAGSVTTEPLAYGPTRNPWSTGHSAGGSSGGSAAAVAAGLVPAAHGNDMGGSIRLPASQCGLVGLKPSRGRTSTGPDFNDYWSGSTHEGVLTRSVRDTAAFLDVMAVPHPGDYFVAPPPSASFSALMAREPGRLRIGLRTDLPGSGRPAHPDHVRAAESVARLLEDMGHRLEAAWPGALDEPEVETLQYQLIGVAFARELDRWGEVLGMPVTADDVEPNTWRFAEMGRPLSAAAYVEVQEKVQAHGRRLSSWWTEGYDLLITPTTSDPPPAIGLLAPLAVQPPRLSRDLTAFLRPWNITGQPAISLPMAWGETGLPVGVQLVAAYGREDLLLQVAHQLEQASPWRDMRPPGLD